MFNINQNEQEKKLDWMYKGANSLVDREDYLLGRSADKTLDQLNAEEKQKQLGTTAPPKNHVEHECIPPSIRDYKRQQQLAEQVDLQAKLQEDPLLVIQKREEESRRQFLQNPVQLAKLQKALSKQQKKLSKRKSHTSEDLDNELSKKLHLLKNNSLGIGYPHDDVDKKHRKVKDLDIILMHKFNALKSKLTDDDLKNIMDGKVTDTDDSDDEDISGNKMKIKKEVSSDEEMPRKKLKKMKKVKKSKKHDSEEESEYKKSKKKHSKKSKKNKKHDSSDDLSSTDDDHKNKKYLKSKYDSKHTSKEAYKTSKSNSNERKNKDRPPKASNEERKNNKYEDFIKENFKEFKNDKHASKKKDNEDFRKTRDSFETCTSDLRHELADEAKYRGRNRSNSRDREIVKHDDKNSKSHNKTRNREELIKNRYDRKSNHSKEKSKDRETRKQKRSNVKRESTSESGEMSRDRSNIRERNSSISREAPRNRSNSQEVRKSRERSRSRSHSRERNKKRLHSMETSKNKSSSKKHKKDVDNVSKTERICDDSKKDKIKHENKSRDQKYKDRNIKNKELDEIEKRIIRKKLLKEFAKLKRKAKVESDSSSSSDDSSADERNGKRNKKNEKTLDSSSSSSSSECNAKEKKRIFGPQRPDFSLQENSDSDAELKKPQNFGLVKSDGTKIPLTNIKPIIKEKAKTIEVARKGEPRERRKKLTEKESEKLRLEMMANAAVRDVERAKNLKIHRETDLKEANNTDFNLDFVHKELLKSANNSTVESRIRANLNNIQRSGRDMNSHFSRRN